MADNNDNRTVPTWIMGLDVEIPGDTNSTEVRRAAMDILRALQRILAPHAHEPVFKFGTGDGAAHDLAATAFELMSAADELDDLKAMALKRVA